MSRKPRTPSAVTEAQALVEAKIAELRAAQDTVRRVEKEHQDAMVALRGARTEADYALPRCRLVQIAWRSHEEQNIGQVVILRKTAGGMLVVRRVGDTEGELRFKWRASGAKFVEAKKFTSHTYSWFELRDVPTEYLPGTEGGAA